MKVHAAMSNSSNPSLILASTSVYRRELLERLGIPFTVISPEVDETPLPGESTLELALRLAKAKAAAVAKDHPDAWVPTGSVYLFKTENLKTGSLYGNRVMIMETDATINLNSEADWLEAEKLCQK